jgi:methionyl-tRNA formyltransferase
MSRKIAVLTSKKSWFVPHAREFVSRLKREGYHAKLFFEHKRINRQYKLVFILSYFNLIGKEFLLRHEHNLVVHESELPRGRGWSPFFWQVLEGKLQIPVVLFEAGAGIDEGDIYLRDRLKLKGHELYPELRDIQAKKSIELCRRFLMKRKTLTAVKQKGKPSYYKRRTLQDSGLNINKTIKEQFNKLRICCNEEFPAFFNYKGFKYNLLIRKKGKT